MLDSLYYFIQEYNVYVCMYVCMCMRISLALIRNYKKREIPTNHHFTWVKDSLTLILSMACYKRTTSSINDAFIQI